MMEKIKGIRRETWLLILLAGVLLLSVAYLVDSTYNPFIYWNF